MPEILWWAGLVLLAVAFLVAQRRFYAVHVRKKGWQPNPWRSFVTFPSDVDRMTWQRDEDPEIERARRIYLAHWLHGAFWRPRECWCNSWRALSDPEA